MTRTEARQYLIEHCKPHYAQGDRKWNEAINMAIDVLSQRWIPCKERMPEVHEEVIASGRMGDIHVVTYVKINDTLYGWEDEYGYWVSLDAVTAWMHLPIPFDGGTDA